MSAASEEMRKAWQGELDYAAGLAIQSRADDEGPSPSHFAKGYVRARRRQQGFSWIETHPRLEMMLPIWAEVMRYSSPEVTQTELDAFFSLAGDDDDLQAHGLAVIADRRLDFGRERVLTALSQGGPRSVDAAVRALAFLEGDNDGKSGKPSAQTILLALLPKLAPARAAMLASEIIDLEHGKRNSGLAQRVLAASPHGGEAAVHLTLARALGADDATLLQRFRELPAGQAQVLATEGPRGLARLLLVISAAEGVDILALAAAWVSSGTDDDANAAVHALSQIDSAPARTVIAQALSHPDFEVRCAAITALASDADAAEKSALLALKIDPSAPVRKTLAAVIGEQRWLEGFDTLLALLGDRRNYARHPEYQRRDEPEYHVARAAAAALSRYDDLPDDVVERIILFLNQDRSKTIDVVLHTSLIDLLTYPNHQSVWVAIEEGLKDDHVVGDKDENLYPIRYSAGWAVVHRTSRYVSETNMVPWAEVAKAAEHVDPQLAALTLLAIGGRLAEARDAASLEVLRNPDTTPARVALALSMIDDFEEASALARKYGLLPTNHAFLDTDDDLAQEITKLTRWPLSTRARDWLTSISSGTDVETTLLWVLSQRTGVPLIAEDFDPVALRRNEVTPITTLAEMFGMQ